jgi:hypothetical protein
MFGLSRLRVLFVLFVCLAGALGGAQGVAAEEVPAEVALPIYASLCADGFAPHDDCSPWEGALVTVTTGEGASIGECTTATFFETVAGCEVVVERGTTAVATISLDTLPVGYTLGAAQLVVDVPVEGDPEGPMFLAVAVDDGGDLTALPVYASICSDALAPNDDCQPWEGVVISAETADGTYNDVCVTATFFETVAGCEILMPRGTTVTAYISEEQIPAGYELFTEVPIWEMPVEGELESGPYFFLVKTDGGETPVPTKTPAAKPTATAPVKALPSTGDGNGPEQGDATMLVLLAGAGVTMMLGGVYVYAHRER